MEAELLKEYIFMLFEAPGYTVGIPIETGEEYLMIDNNSIA